MNKKIVFSLASITLVHLFSSHREAAAGTFIPEPQGTQMPFESKDGSTGLFSGLTDSMSSALPGIYETGMNVISIFFIVAVIGYSMSLLFKNGQWMKWSAGVMMSSLLVILVLRGGPILFYSTTVIGVPALIKDIINFLTTTGVFIAIGMLLTSLLFRFTYKLIKHPDYHRWSRRLMVGSVLVAILSTTVPIIFMYT
ncbi:hypothetical protein ACFVAD_20480 [Sutcliffiella sp. NPDC057660]|uniref:hypothetical protein n=1 Tax=Sutcliffiella sp. NPDC057660 TaxID=3346199 RepID=UPI0036B908CB